MNMILIQAIYYGIVMILTIFVISILLRGFFWKFLKVKTSFGKYIMVQIKTVHRDYFEIGWVEQGFLCYDTKKEKRKVTMRHIIKDKNVFFRVLGVAWVLVDEETNALLKPDLFGVTGYDAVKFDDIITRAIESPKINDMKELILIVGVGVSILIGIGLLVFTIQNTNNIGLILQGIETLKTTTTSAVPIPAPI